MYDATALCLRYRADPPSHVTRRHRHERERDGPEYGVAPQCLLCGLESSAPSHTGATAAPASRRSVSTEGTNTRPQIRHQSNRALLGAMGRVCSRRRRRSRAWRARDVSNYGAVTPPRRGPRPHASAEEPLPQYSVPYASRNPGIGPNHSHRMRRSELCRGANGRGHATERIGPLHAIHRRRHERGVADRNARPRCMTRSAVRRCVRHATEEVLRRPRAVTADRPRARIAGR